MPTIPSVPVRDTSSDTPAPTTWRRPRPTRPPLDTALRGLSRSANKGRLWLGLAAAGALIPGDTRRAAVRGVASLAITSAVANGLLKPVFRRRRPDLELTPVLRRLRRQPHTTSFPSGHAASAAAFTAGVALESPVLAAAVAPLAGAVAYSRVHVGVHHVSDVVGGAALGAGIALAALRWWPVRPARPAAVRHQRLAPALPGGRGLLVVVNPKSGPDGVDPSDEILRLLPAARIVEASPDLDLDALLTEDGEGIEALGVAGGDGTVAAVAAHAYARGLPLAVFPSGTLNHFARDAGITSFTDTRHAIEHGEALAFDIATVGGTAFLNTASIGGYPEMVRRREMLEHRLGKWLAMAVATGQTLRSHEPMRLTLDGRPVTVWSLFVGNCRYIPRGAFPAWRPQLDDGLLDIQYLRAGRFSRTRAVLAILAGTAGRSRVFRAHTARSLTVESASGPVDLAGDGEPIGSFTACEFAKLPGPLTVYRPAPTAP